MRLINKTWPFLLSACYWRLMPLIILTLLASGCSTHQTYDNPTPLAKEGKWLILPITNYSQTPMAGERAEAILETNLHALGVRQVIRYPTHLRTPVMGSVNQEQVNQRARQWREQQQPDYIITGSVEEWRYKSGLDGEPAVGISLKIMTLSDNKVLWSGSASRSGWPKESLAGTAQTVIDHLTDDINW